MEKLSGIDRAYVGLESSDVPADFLGIIMLDPSTAPDRHDFERVRAEAAAYVPSVPALVRRLVSAPLASAPEQWVVDPDFDVDRHLGRVACPSPGDLAALRQLALDLASRPLERDRPLWRVWYVEGLAEGGAAVLLQFHHAAIDGMGAMDLFKTMFDTEPRPIDPGLTPAIVEGQRVPSGPEVLLRTLPDQAAAPLRAVRGVLDLAGSQLKVLGGSVLDALTGSGGGSAGGSGEGSDADSAWVALPPDMVFNRAPRTFERSLALTTVPLDDVKAVARSSGATVNDVVLALVTGALRTYLGDRGELPDEPLRAACPVSVRTEDDEGGGNAFTAMLVPLPTHLEDPAERLRYIAEATAARKPRPSGGSGGSGTSPARTLLELVDTVPSTMFSMLGGLASAGALTTLPPAANLIVSNVKGPDAELYLAGAKITHLYARTMAGPGLGVMIHCISYAGHLDFGITALRDLVPEPDVLIDGFADQLALLG